MIMQINHPLFKAIKKPHYVLSLDYTYFCVTFPLLLLLQLLVGDIITYVTSVHCQMK